MSSDESSWMLFESAWIPFESWVEAGLGWIVDNFRPFFQLVRKPVDVVLSGLEHALITLPDWLVLIVLVLVAWQAGGRSVALSAFGCLAAIGVIGVWQEAMITLSIVLTCIVFCTVVGIPIGIVASQNDRLWTALRPVLDLMQTIPAFVYLVPVVMLFGIGNVPGVIVTTIYALPPVIRLTNLGIRQVDKELVEAALAFGCTRRQRLLKVQVPLAVPTIMAGVNQTVMMALSMVVVASMISVSGLGQMVLRGIGRLDMGIATSGGVGIVLLAIAIDRISQSMANQEHDPAHRAGKKQRPLGMLIEAYGRIRMRK